MHKLEKILLSLAGLIVCLNITAQIIYAGINVKTSGVAAGVSSFNGRTGPVNPQTGDYTAVQVGAQSSVTGSCPGQAISIINSNGTVSCIATGGGSGLVTLLGDVTGSGTGTVNTVVTQGSTTQAGKLQVVDSVTSTDISSAASPSSVKVAYDLAVTKQTSAQVNSAVLSQASSSGWINSGATVSTAQSTPWSGITGMPQPVTALSNTNTGDETSATIITKLTYTPVSVLTTVNGKPLSSNVTLANGDIGSQPTLTGSISGTPNQITVTPNSNSVASNMTFSLPQNIDTGASVIFAVVSAATISTSTVINGAHGGTGTANTGRVAVLAGDLVTSGASTITLVSTGPTTVTLPVSGTLLATTGSGSSLTGITYSQLSGEKYSATSFSAVTTVTVTHNFGAYPIVQVLDNTNAVIIPASITHNSANAVTVAFGSSTSGTILLMQ